MFRLNNRNINTLSKFPLNHTVIADHWLQKKSVANNLEVSSHYADICQQNKHQHKWVLFINPEEASMDQLASFDEIDTSKALCATVKVSTKGENKKAIELIKQALSQGNCSAVVLSNTILNQEEVAQLELYAAMGETRCEVLNNQNIMH